MTEAEARDQLEMMCAACLDPKLSFDEIRTILNLSRLADSEGRAPSDAAWAPGWDLDRAAARGWEMKAAKTANHHDAPVGGRAFSAAQVYEHCMAMARHYRRRINGTVTITTTPAPTTEV